MRELTARRRMARAGTSPPRSAASDIEFGLTPGAPHRLQNALAALASIHAAGLDAAALAKELGHVGIMTGRGVEQAAGGVTVIDDSFNGNPASMVAALDSLKARPVQAAAASPFSATCWSWAPTRRPITRSCAEATCPASIGVYCVGPLMRHLYDLLRQRARLARDPATLEPRGRAMLRAGDVVVVKGAKRCSG